MATITAQATQHGIELVWQESDQGDTFNVHRSTDEVNYSSIASGVSDMSYLDAGGVAGTTYFYYVTAVKNGLESGPSPIADAVFPTVPTPPSSLTATAQ